MCSDRTVSSPGLMEQNGRVAPLGLFSPDRLAPIGLPAVEVKGPAATSATVADGHLPDLRAVQPGADAYQPVREAADFAWAAREVHERGRYLLLAIVRPFLPYTTWTEAVEVVQNGGAALPTRTRRASILWLDIANFTQAVDNHPLEEVISALTAYLDLGTQLIYDHGGDVNKYLGDGLLSIFADADAAVQAAGEIQQAVANFNRGHSNRGELVFPTRIGIDSGRIAVVSLGSRERQDRTVLGMPVNLAKRLQERAPIGRVWLSQATFDELRDRAGCRRIGPVEFKGLRQPVVVYEKR